VLRDYPDTKYAEEMEYLTIKAEYQYAYHSNTLKQEDRFGQVISYEQQFAEKYPSSKYLADAVSIKKDSEQGIAKAKRELAQYASDLKYARRFQKRDTLTGNTPVDKTNTNQKAPAQ